MKKLFLFLIIVAAILLRLYRISDNPPSLYWDEASLGYNAYSVLKTGFDEHGEFYPLARFMAFGDYKPPGYIYTSALSVFTFGLNEFSIRFPSALSGILMVVVTYLFTKELFGNSKISLLASFFTAISAWSIHLSRVAYEANLAALFNLTAVYFFLLSRKKGFYIIISMLFFLAAFYTFNANRIISPLLFLSLFLIHFNQLSKNIKWNILSLVLAFILLLPSFKFLLSSESRLRLQEVSIFTNPTPVTLANSRIEIDKKSPIAKIIHNRRLMYLTDFAKHYSDNFTGRFLFTHGDINPRLHVQGMGQLYFFDIPWVLLGIIYLLLKKNKSALLIFIWMLVSAIPAGVARETPHALRIASVLPTYQIISALGLYKLYSFLRIKLSPVKINLAVIALSFLLLVNTAYYLHIHHLHFPFDDGGEFQYGTKEMVTFIKQRFDLYQRIYVTPEIGRPYIFFALYLPYEPQQLLKDIKYYRDPFGFYEVESLGKIKFNLKEADQEQRPSIIVSKNKNFPGNYHLIKIINDTKGLPYLYLADNK